MLYHVFHGSKHRDLVLKPSIMYGAKDFDLALSYAKNRYDAHVTYVHRLIFTINRPATGEDVEAAALAIGGRPPDALSQGDLLRYDRILALLLSRGFDGAVDLLDFGYDSDFDEIPVMVVFNALRQAQVVDLEPHRIVDRRSPQ